MTYAAPFGSRRQCSPLAGLDLDHELLLGIRLVVLTRHGGGVGFGEEERAAGRKSVGSEEARSEEEGRGVQPT